MSLPDKHDKREFRQYAHIAEDGSVLAVSECVANKVPVATTNSVHFVEVTALYPCDIYALRESDILEMLAARG